MSYHDKICFSLQGSLSDLISGAVPNYSRLQTLWIEQTVEDSVGVVPVKASRPALVGANQGIYLEPASINEVSYSSDLAHGSWIKGQNALVRPNIAIAPDKTLTADRVLFLGDRTLARQLQLISRRFSLQPNTEYTLSLLLKLVDGTFSGNDTVTLTGGLRELASINFSQLNPYRNKYRFLETQFKTLGSDVPDGGFTNQIGDRAQWRVVEVQQQVLSLELTSDFAITGVGKNELAGSRIAITSGGQGIYEIRGNTALRANVGVFEVEVAELSSTTKTGDLCTILPSQRQEVTLELYAETSVSFDVGTIQIEPLSVRSSPIFQTQNKTSRSEIELTYPRSPIAGLQDFAVFWQIGLWRGQVNLFDSADFRVAIVEVASNLTEIVIFWQEREFKVALTLLPQKFTLLVQVEQNTRSLKCFLEGRLLLEESLEAGGLVGVNASLDLSNQLGVVAIEKLICFSSSLTDGQPPLLGYGGMEVKELFAQEQIAASSILTRSLILNLPSLTIPAGGNPILEEESDAAEATGEKAQGEKTEFPGRASVRFPYTPIDAQKILGLSLNRVKVNSTAGFKLGRAFIVNQFSEDLAELKVVEINAEEATLALEPYSEGIFGVGDTIVQPQKETLISPHNYFVEIRESLNNVVLSHKSANAIVLDNYNPRPVTLSPYLLVFL